MAWLGCPGLCIAFQIKVHIFMVGGGGDGQKEKENLSIQHSVYFLMAGTPTHLRL